MENRDWNKLWFNSQLNIELFQSVRLKEGFPMHMHDYYVICFIERGLQSFTHRGTKHLTPAGGLNMLNPGDGHTGEPVDDHGFEVRSIYPTVSHMQEAVYELTGRHQGLPFFKNVRADDLELTRCARHLHQSLINNSSPIECESLLLWLLAKSILRYAVIRPPEQAVKTERRAVAKACAYICDHFADRITLTELAGHVGLSRYYLLRVFRKEKGMPPHAYLESVRISRARELLERGRSPSQVAFASGFSDQSHFTNRFKRFIGVTPGQYAHEIRS